MTIKNMQPLNMQEVKKIVKELPETEKTKQIEVFIKKFSKISDKDAEKLKQGLESLGILKLKEEHIAKIEDVMPEDASDVNKIFIDISLDEDETNKILEAVKKYS